MNGPLAIKNCTGTTEVDAVNGPLALSELGGTVKATSQNGPLAINLTGSAWEGEGLDARANNGPLSLHVPESYQSGVQVTLSNHGPLSCRAKSCAQAMQQWQSGKGPAAVRRPHAGGARGRHERAGGDPLDHESPGSRAIAQRSRVSSYLRSTS